MRRRNALPALPLLLPALACGEPGPEPPLPTEPWVLDSASFVVTGVAEGHPELFLVRNRRDTVWTRLTAREGLDNSATWSPDGALLVFHSDRSATDAPDLDLFLVEPGSGRPAVQLTFEPGFDYLPAFSPDGRHVAFLSRRAEIGYPEGSPGHIYLLALDGTGVRRVTRVPISASLGPAWMPDGESLLIARRLEDDGPTILSRVWIDLTVPRDEPVGIREEVLVADAFFNYTPIPSPDGRRLAYTAEADGVAGVVVMDLETRQRTLLTDQGFNYVDGWTPDGERVVVTRWYPAFQRRDAWLLDPEGVEPEEELLQPVHRSASNVAFRPPTGRR